jgi:iron complex outermembrane receptor protein
MSYRSYWLATAACASVLAASFATSASAQDETTVADVIVTGQRQHYRGDIPIKDLPQAVQVISAETLRDVAVTRLPEALDLAAGVARQNSFGGVWDAFAIRGFAGDINVPSGYLVNGFNARGFAGLRDTSAVERIEVLKGPGSALFGQGEPGGTVYISTKKPLFKTGGSLSGSVGSYAFYRGEGDFTTPLTDNVAVRVNGAVESTRSFRDTLKSKRYFLTPSILANLGESTSISYELEWSRQKIPFDRGVVARNGVLGIIPQSRFLGEPGDGPQTAKALGHQVELQHDFSDDWTLLAGFSHRDTKLSGFGQTPELVASRQPFFTTGTILSRQRRFSIYDSADTIVRAEVSGKFDLAGMTHHLLFGADYDRFRLQRYQTRYRPPVVAAGQTLTQQNAVNIFNPAYGNLSTPNAFVFDDTERDKSFGFYVTDQIDLTDTLKIRVGARWDKFKQSIANRLSVLQPPDQDVDAFSPQAGIIFEPTQDLTFYAAYAKGFRPNSGFDFNRNPFEPEKTKSAEVGVKFQAFDGKLQGTLAAFKMTKTNVITADPVNQGFSVAIGKARSKGIELETSGELPGAVRFMFSYAYTKAESASDVREPDFGKLVAAGDPLLNIPKHNVNLLVFKDFKVNDRKLTLGGNVKHVSKRLGETGTTFFLPSYTIVRLNASYEINDHLEVSAQVNNLFDKKYYPASYATLWVLAGEPRTYQARITYRY